MLTRTVFSDDRGQNYLVACVCRVTPPIINVLFRCARVTCDPPVIINFNLSVHVYCVKTISTQCRVGQVMRTSCRCKCDAFVCLSAICTNVNFVCQCDDLLYDLHTCFSGTNQFQVFFFLAHNFRNLIEFFFT